MTQEFPRPLSPSRAKEYRLAESAAPVCCQAGVSPTSGACPGTGRAENNHRNTMPFSQSWSEGSTGCTCQCSAVQTCQTKLRGFSWGSDYSFCGNGGLCP